MLFEMTAPCHFGLEAVLKRELHDLGFDGITAEDGRVNFTGNEKDLCRANIFLRTAGRILIRVGEFNALTFEELFESTRALPWECYLAQNARFWVTKATSVDSKLYSTPSIQRIMKKAMVARMQEHYRTEVFPETGSDYPVRVLLRKNHVSVYLDTSGDSLHKRGYRTVAGEAPISEALAAALIMLTPWRKDRILVDPCCGSGTFPIEAAMMAAHIAPGMNRSFTAQAWTDLIPEKIWRETFDEARAQVCKPERTDIRGFDIDREVLKLARANAKAAGVADLIHFQQMDVADVRHPKKYGFVITNPPYGERMDETLLPEIYTKFGQMAATLQDWSVFMITSYKDAEKYFGKKADKKRKIYNGMLRTDYLQFFGAKPPKRKQEL